MLKLFIGSSLKQTALEIQPLSKKGQQVTLGLLSTFAIIFVLTVITTTIGAKIVQEFGDSPIFENGTVAKNLSTQGNQGLQQFAEFYPITGLVLIGSVIIGLLVAFR